MIVYSAKREKGRRNRVLPMTPDFAEMLSKVPEIQRRGLVFRWKLSKGLSQCETYVVRQIGKCGKEAGIVVGKTARGRDRYATAHDLRRSFGTRWATKVMPVVLRGMMRHSSLATTMAYYVNVDADRMADEIYDAWDS